MTLKFFDSIQSVSAEAWDRVVDPDFPFFLYHFLCGLETTDCLGSRTGWYPVYITVWAGEVLVAATVLYQKTNSWGEYVFDFAWADAHASMKERYFPKLVSAAPFTPSTGRKLHFASELSEDERASAAKLILEATENLREQLGASSTHILFCPEAELKTFEQAGFFKRVGFQYHWQNHGYQNFDDFLSALRSKRRHELKREREQVVKSGVAIEILSGAQLSPKVAALFYDFYLSTIDKKSSFDYLSREFFAYIFAHLNDKLVLMLARDASGEPVAGALNYRGVNTLYGRNWGCVEEYRSLHFELCYYQGIEYAIAQKLQRFEAGAQGEHKFNRGFLPVKTYSAHKIRSPKLDGPIRDFCEVEAEQIELMLERTKSHTPYSRKS